PFRGPAAVWRQPGRRPDSDVQGIDGLRELGVDPALLMVDLRRRFPDAEGSDTAERLIAWSERVEHGVGGADGDQERIGLDHQLSDHAPVEERGGALGTGAEPD